MANPLGLRRLLLELVDQTFH